MQKIKQAYEFFKKKPLYLLALIFVCAVVGNFAMAAAERHPDLACSPCHVMKPYVDNYHDSNLLSHTHARANIDCIDCHENGLDDKIQETVWYVTDDFDDPPYKRAFPNEMCVKCHDNFDEITSKTNYAEANPHNSHLGTMQDIKCSDCHTMHDPQRAICADCHSFAFLQELPENWDKK